MFLYLFLSLLPFPLRSPLSPLSGEKQAAAQLREEGNRLKAEAQSVLARAQEEQAKNHSEKSILVGLNRFLIVLYLTYYSLSIVPLYLCIVQYDDV